MEIIQVNENLWISNENAQSLTKHLCQDFWNMKKQRPQMSLRKRTIFLVGLQEIKKSDIHDQKIMGEKNRTSKKCQWLQGTRFSCPSPQLISHQLFWKPQKIGRQPWICQCWVCLWRGELGIKQLVRGSWPTVALSVLITLP